MKKQSIPFFFHPTRIYGVSLNQTDPESEIRNDGSGRGERGHRRKARRKIPKSETGMTASILKKKKKIRRHERFKPTLFIRTNTILGVFPFIKLQNDT